MTEVERIIGTYGTNAAATTDLVTAAIVSTEEEARREVRGGEPTAAPRTPHRASWAT